jgi:hypothetical protein
MRLQIVNSKNAASLYVVNQFTKMESELLKLLRSLVHMQN